MQEAPQAKMPRNIKPMLAFPAKEPFDHADWLFEIKWDGFRAIAEIDHHQVNLYSRTFQSFNQRFTPIVEELQSLKIQAIFDGEIVVVDEEGKSNFQALQNYQKTGIGDLRYYVFDLLYYKGKDLRSLPLLERKQILQTLLPKSRNSLLLYSDHIITQGKKFFEEVKKKHLEGMMAKNVQSSYESKRNKSWLKIKTHERQEALICGFTPPKGSRQKFGALLLGVYGQNALEYIGLVGGGFNRKTLTQVMEQLQPLKTEKCPFSKSPKINQKVTWVKPKLICEVSFAEWTKDNLMRQPIFLGIRSDKDPKQVKKEIPLSPSKTPANRQNEPPLTHLDKIFWPKEQYTKGDLINYYRQMAPYILPYLKDRPQSLHRFPNGIESEGFFHKNIDKGVPEWVPHCAIKHDDKDYQYLMISDVKSLLFAINLGCIDLNPFNSRIQHLNYPDYMVLDLDPEKVPFDKVIETAQTIHELLSSHDIPNYCKTSGATGLHIYLPLGARYPYEHIKQFAELLSLMIHDRLPNITSVVRSPAKRQRKVYLDYLQNHLGQTVAAPYCVRPRPGAPVSTPLEWSEVKHGLDPTSFNMKTIFSRLKKKGDIFLPVLGKGISLLRCLKKLQN